MCSLSLRSVYPNTSTGTIVPLQASITPAPAPVQADMTMISQALMTATFWGALLTATPAILSAGGMAVGAFNAAREKDNEKREAKLEAQRARADAERRRREAAYETQQKAAERERLIRLKMEDAERDRQYELARMAWQNEQARYNNFQRQQQYIAPPRQSNLPALRRSGDTYYNY